MIDRPDRAVHQPHRVGPNANPTRIDDSNTRRNRSPVGVVKGQFIRDRGASNQDAVPERRQRLAEQQIGKVPRLANL